MYSTASRIGRRVERGQRNVYLHDVQSRVHDMHRRAQCLQCGLLCAVPVRPEQVNEDGNGLHGGQECGTLRDGGLHFRGELLRPRRLPDPAHAGKSGDGLQGVGRQSDAHGIDRIMAQQFYTGVRQLGGKRVGEVFLQQQQGIDRRRGAACYRVPLPGTGPVPSAEWQAVCARSAAAGKTRCDRQCRVSHLCCQTAARRAVPALRRPHLSLCLPAEWSGWRIAGD